MVLTLEFYNEVDCWSKNNEKVNRYADLNVL